ncbi:lipoprotein-releasing system permease protein [Hydrogenobacter hydrogenophilus]|uniref:Lipoprotein-releasing system permease protein n=2 Tax=Hydrogenobacter hydrogenophilus TaxID=35835 RepID=A0A285NVR4_9AQUI|nr:lipoprotein-releasing system permease protein [Hydrogenobacter hydrogenophilus]
MSLKTIIRISIKYVLTSKGSTLLVSLIALLGVILSVCAILLTMGVFAGFQHALKEKILSTSPHIVISITSDENIKEYEEKLSLTEGIKRAYPVVLYQGILSKDDSLQSVSVKGMRPSDMLQKKRFLVEGSFKGGLLIGKGLADIMGIKVGQEITLVSPVGRSTPFGFLPKVGHFRVDGIFQTGTFDQDYLTVLMSMSSATEFFGSQWQLYGFEVYLQDPYKAQEIKKQIEKELGTNVIVRSWIDLNKPLFNALQLEKVGIFFVLLLMVIVASFNITSLLFMKVKEKTRDIAIFRTFGMKKKEVAMIFLFQGMTIGVFGSLCGLLLSLLGGYLINEYKLVRVPADVYLMDHVPVFFEVSDVFITIMGAFFLSLIASLLPAYRASKTSIVEILRNE